MSKYLVIAHSEVYNFVNEDGCVFHPNPQRRCKESST
jgi:hypothetical protein